MKVRLGRCTFTATQCWPCRRALYTWPRLAAAIGVGKLLKQFLGRRTKFLRMQARAVAWGKGRQIVPQACQFLQPVPTHQIRSGGEGLSQLDEAGPRPVRVLRMRRASPC